MYGRDEKGMGVFKSSMPLSFEEESGYKQTCLCIENLVKKKNYTQLKATEECFNSILGIEINIQEEMKSDPDFLKTAIDEMTNLIMKNDNRYKKNDANKLSKCIAYGATIKGLTTKELAKECDHLIYPNTKLPF